MPDQAAHAIEPFGARILVEDPPAQDETGPGLILPADSVPLRRGVVVATGWDREEDNEHLGFLASMLSMRERGLKPGDVVYFNRDCGDEIGKQRILDLECVKAVERT